MSLDFTDIPDREGAAIYILVNNSATMHGDMDRLSKDINEHATEAQVFVIDIASQDGEKTRDFYDINPDTLPAVLIVADDDQLRYSWTGAEIPAADMIAHLTVQ